MSTSRVTVECVVEARPAAVFAIVSDPPRHPEIDGSGMVKAAPASDERVSGVGDRFGMQMKWGIGYEMTNVVTEYDPDRRFVWRPLVARPAWLGKLAERSGGHVWGYELEAVGDTTRVRHFYDWSGAPAAETFYIRAARWPDRAGRAMTGTLDRLAEVVAAGDAPSPA